MFPKVLQDAKNKRDEQKRLICKLYYFVKAVCMEMLKVNDFFDMPLHRFETLAHGMRQMFVPFEEVARDRHVCPCCERAFTPDEEDEFVKKVGDGISKRFFFLLKN